MDFDIVIATRNRQAALRLSLPLMLAQSRLPVKLILVDSSDDHGATKRRIESVLSEANTPIQVEIISSLPGSAYQRNVGLKEAASPVVFFPDDDALWFPGFAEAVMTVYERDRDDIIGGVGGMESSVSPIENLAGGPGSYSMEARDRLQLHFGRLLDSLEYRLFPDPLFLEGQRLMNVKPVPSWLAEMNAVPTPVFPGFMMSFRTELMGPTGFDETLGRYALFEDYDACLNVSKTHLLVAALGARVFHFRSPEKRVNGLEWGAIQVLNRAYVVNKHSSPGSLSRRHLAAFSYYKLLRYAAQAATGYGRERLRGTLRGLRLMGRLLSAGSSDLPATYSQLRNQALHGRG